MDPITSILDARLPQPHAWNSLPAAVRKKADSLSRERADCSDERVEEIDREMIMLLLPYRRGIEKTAEGSDPDAGSWSDYQHILAGHQAWLKQ